jgi:hypothetical protein
LEDWDVQKSALLEEVRLETRRDDLLAMLEDRFGPLPEEVVRRVQATTDLAKLKAALRGVPSLESLDKLPL